MAHLDGFFQLHGAVAVFEDRACLLVGPPDSGKTTLALGCAEAGAALFSDEIALVEASPLKVHAFPRDLIVHDESQDLFSELMRAADPESFKTQLKRRYVAPNRLCRTGTQMANIALILFPELEVGSAVEFRREGEAKAAELLLDQALNLPTWAARGVELTARLVESCPAVRMTFGDARRAAIQIPRMLEGKLCV